MRVVIAAVTLAFALTAVPSVTAAQPKDSQIKKDMKGSGVKKIKLTRKKGTKQWNSDVKAYEFVRGVEIIRASDMKGVDLIVVGDAVYQLYGSKWKYWKFRVIENRYDGLPNPTEAEALAQVRQHMNHVVGGRYNKIVGEVRDLRLVADAGFTWHNPNSVSFTVVMSYDYISSNTEVDSVEVTQEVRLYRDDPKAPWSDRPGSSDRGMKKLGSKEYSSDEIKAMTTLGEAESENKAKAAKNALPAVQVPEFATAEDLVRFTDKMLRTGTAEELQAYLMQVLAPSSFVEGSEVQLTQYGADLINKAVDMAFKRKATYRLEYCEEPLVDSKRSSKTRFYLLGVIKDVSTQIAVGQFGGTFKEGVKVGQKWKIIELQVGVKQTDEAIEFINSFSDRKKLCPNDP